MYVALPRATRRSAFANEQISIYGHRKMAELVNAYVNSEVCAMKAEGSTLSIIDEPHLDALYPVTPLPRVSRARADAVSLMAQLRLMQKWNPDEQLGPLRPSCSSVDSVNHPLTPTLADGW
jgi:hypothetical protein